MIVAFIVARSGSGSTDDDPSLTISRSSWSQENMALSLPGFTRRGDRMPSRLSDRAKIRRDTARADRLTRRPPTLTASVPACRPGSTL